MTTLLLLLTKFTATFTQLIMVFYFSFSMKKIQVAEQHFDRQQDMLRELENLEKDLQNNDAPIE